jgi:hypothetical protein
LREKRRETASLEMSWAATERERFWTWISEKLTEGLKREMELLRMDEMTAV